MKKINFLFLKSIILLLAMFFNTKNIVALMNTQPMPPMPMGYPPMPGGPQDFPTLPKDFDPEFFDKMLQELEEIFGPESADDQKPPEFPTKKPAQLPSDVKEAGKKPLPTYSNKDNFINPAEMENNKPIKKLPKEKLEAFNYYMNKFIISITNVEIKINRYALGISFKEDLENLTPSFTKIIGSIKTNTGYIKSKALYPKAFFLPTFTEMRKKIIDLIEKLENAENKISQLEESEEDDEDFEFLSEKISSKESKKDKKNAGLKGEIKTLFSQEIKNVSSDLEKILVSPQAKTAIEEKKKLQDAAKKKAEELSKKSGYKPSSSWRQPSSSPWGGGGYHPSSSRWDSSGGRDYSSNYPSNYPGSSNQPPQLETPKPEDEKKPDSTSSGGQRPDAAEIERLENITKFKKEILELFAKIKSTYKAGDETTYTTIFKTKNKDNVGLLSSLLGKYEDLLKLQEKNKVKDENPEINNALNEFIPIGVRLAKYPTRFTSESDCARKLIEKSPDKMLPAAKAYEDDILKRITSKDSLASLTEYDETGNKLTALFKNIQILQKQPRGNDEKIKTELLKSNIANLCDEGSKNKDSIIGTGDTENLKKLKKSFTDGSLKNLTTDSTASNSGVSVKDLIETETGLKKMLEKDRKKLLTDLIAEATKIKPEIDSKDSKLDTSSGDEKIKEINSKLASKIDFITKQLESQKATLGKIKGVAESLTKEEEAE